MKVSSIKITFSMKQIVIAILIFAGIIDYLAYQGVFDSNKLYINYNDNGEVKEKRYFPEDICLHIEIECSSYTFYEVRLKDDFNLFIAPKSVSGRAGKPYYQSYDGLTEGIYELEIIDNFGIHKSHSITINENKTLTYDDIMNLFYPKSILHSLPNHLRKGDIIRFNITEENIFCSGYNAMLYRDDLSILTLKLYQKNNTLPNEIVEVNIFKLKENFLEELNSIEEDLNLKSETKNAKKEYETLEFIFSTRTIYNIPINNNNSFKTNILDLINSFSYESELKEVRRY